MTEWHVITGEYPPQPGGVSDYTRGIARALAAAGDRVTVFAPPAGGDAAPEPGITVHRLPDCYGRRSLREMDAVLKRARGPRRLLVQYVPQAFGWRAANLPFCWWLKSRRPDAIWVMFHEVATPIEPHQPLAHRALALVTRQMAGVAAAAADRAFVSIPAWEPTLRSLGLSAPVEWLPVPSAIPVVDDPAAIAAVRDALSGGLPLAGHFGTYGAHTRPLVEGAVRALLEASACRVLLLGRGSDSVAAELVRRVPAWASRISGTGELEPCALSIHLSACDVMLQPYPDGVSSRRTSTMAALAHGLAVATTDGALTESIWRESGAVVLAGAEDAPELGRAAAALVADPGRAADLGRRGRALYDARFDIRHAVAALRAQADRPPLVAAS